MLHSLIFVLESDYNINTLLKKLTGTLVSASGH